ncbi:polydeoxyribonucleotide synthase [Mycobacterium tuberculosis]|nr:polydeoxyribonucleotide synthase [Mycobacterium tuberculosis]
MDVAATSSRLTKVARIAALLHRAAPDTQLVTIIVSWLSGELPQRHIGVGWAALRSLPPPAPQPALTVTGVDATLSKIGTLSGKGSQAQRAALVAELFSAATEAEQTFLLRLLGGRPVRRGAGHLHPASGPTDRPDAGTDRDQRP